LKERASALGFTRLVRIVIIIFKRYTFRLKAIIIRSSFTVS